MTREEFMNIVYSELHSDGDNYRANRIIDAADEYAEDSSSEKPNKWIPCSERLPKENGVYIISYEDAVTWLEWFNGKWFFYPSNPAREETGTIIAWMPLPLPYKQEV